MTSAGVASAFVEAEQRRGTSADSGIDFALRGKTPPPFEISALS